MSTTAAIGYFVDEERKAIGIRNDGYPDYVLAHLIVWLNLYGFDKYKRAIDNSKGYGGLEFETDYDPNKLTKGEVQHGKFLSTNNELTNYDWTYIVNPKGKVVIFQHGRAIRTVRWDLSDEKKRKAIRQIYKSKDNLNSLRDLMVVLKGLTLIGM
jgi:hypothetical protein